MRVLAVLQARMSSTRLQGKVLMDLLGKPMLARQLERVGRARRLDGVCVATSVDASDAAIEALCNSLSVPVFRGSLQDVLDRYYQAAAPFEPEHVVRVTGDCPLIDPAVIDQLIELHLSGGFDYSSNTLHPTYPDGLDAEICRFPVLQQAWSEARLASEREHVTPFIKTRPERFRLGELRNPQDLSALRWTVDYAEDLAMVREIYARLYAVRPDFSLHDVLDLLAQNPEIAALAARVVRDEGYLKSLAEDRQV